MPTALKAKKQRAVARSKSTGQIPPMLRVLYITTRHRTGGWLAEAFAADSASEILLDQVIGSAAGLSRLRDEVFDVVLVSHEPGELDALELVEGYRGGGADEPIIVLGTQSEQEMAVLSYEVGADGYVCVNTTTTRNLIWVLVRAVQRHQLSQENRRLTQAERSRLDREHDEAHRLLDQQRTMLLTAAPCGCYNGSNGRKHDCTPEVELPPELLGHYRELLRTYVIMGSGTLTQELTRLGDLLVSARLSARQVMQLHLQALADLLQGLGTRSTRHVMSRADLLALEIIVHLAEGYRLRYEDSLHPAVQQWLFGMD
jgi:DNA-binding response OmpR family regulator